MAAIKVVAYCTVRKQWVDSGAEDNLKYPTAVLLSQSAEVGREGKGDKASGTRVDASAGSAHPVAAHLEGYLARPFFLLFHFPLPPLLARAGSEMDQTARWIMNQDLP